MLQVLTWLDTRRLLLVVLFLGIFAMAVRAPADSDLWWHLASGDWMREHGSIPRTDPFSHTMAGRPWIEQGWLPDILTSFVFEKAGYAGLGLLLALIVTAAFAFVFAQSAANIFVRALATLLAAITSAVYWSMRPQIFSFLFFSIVLWILYRHKAGHHRTVWLLLPLVPLWANCHAAWLSGYILIACYLAGESLNRVFRPAGAPAPSWKPLALLALVALLSVPLIAVNPNGVAMLTYPFKTVGIGALRDFIQEWAAPDFHQLHVQPFIWLLLLTLAAIGLAGRRVDFTHLITLAAFCYMALMASRNIALFALVAAPILATYGEDAWAYLWSTLQARWPRLGRLSLGEPAPPRLSLAWFNWLLVFIVLAAVVLKSLQPLSRAFNERVQAEHFPAGAAEFLWNHDLPGQMFNSYNWGGYLIWKLYPYKRVFIDGRTDLYDDAFIRRYLAVTWAQAGWDRTLAQYDVGYIVIERGSFLDAYLALHPDWYSIYQDDMAVIYLRNW